MVHVEDEPEAVYAPLVVLALVPGLEVRLIDTLPDSIRFAVDGKEYSLPPVVAANLTVTTLAGDEDGEVSSEHLSAIQPGEKATIAGISPACRGIQLRRLLDLGFVPGTVVEAELRSPAGDPTAYRVRGSLIALRKDQADLICISRNTNAAPRT